MEERKVRDKIQEMQALIRIGRERIARHSPVWAVYLASETLRSLGDILDELEKDAAPEEAGSGALEASGSRVVRRAV